ncbi:MAG: hypothetical protein NXH75_03490 [Halobacteriovoraceae bacterium]|nr:hypothetical protein [Halobacteriovoraceae bacterium]
MRTFALAMAAMIALTGCINFKGTFTAHEKIKLTHTTIFGNTKTRTIPAGTYNTTFKFSSQDKVKLTFKTGGDDIDVKIKIPAGTNFPQDNGTFKILASRSGQQNNVEGFVNTVRNRSAVTRTRESCSYTTYRRDCRVVCSGANNCRKVCSDYPVTRYGNQEVEYRYNYTDRSLKLQVVAPGSGEILGEYLGEDKDVEKVYLYRGMCF